MGFVQKTEKKLLTAYEKLTATPKDLRLVSIMLYTLLFGIGYVFLIMPIIRESGTISGSDGATQYLPMLLGFRRDIITFFDNLSNGNCEFPMINFGFVFGGDTVVSEVCMFTPFLPLYALSVFVPDELLTSYFAFTIILLLYISGLSFWNMCRYFKKNLLLSGVFSAFYVFCGGIMSNIIWNPHFFVMVISFPFIMIGIDKILHDKSGLALTLSVAWMSLCGFVFLIYTLPFAALFALIRLLHVKKEKLLLNSVKYFSIGICHIILGVLMASVFFLPGLLSFIGTHRVGVNSELNFSSLFIPSADYIYALINSRTILEPISVSSAVIPAFLYSLISGRTSKELKWYSVVLLAVVSLPLIWYGINGFMYDICRWGFIPALYMCYISVDLLPEMLKSDRSDIMRFTFITALTTLLFLAGLSTAGVIVICLFAAATLIPPVEKALEGFFASLTGKITAAYKNPKGKIILFTTAAAIFAAAGIISLFVFNIVVPLISFTLAAVFVSAGAMISSDKKGVYSVVSVTMYTLLILSTAFYYGSIVFDISMVGLNDTYYALKEISSKDDTFGRFSAAKRETTGAAAGSANRSGDFQNVTDQVFLARFDNFIMRSDANIDLSLKYDFPDAEGFVSIIDGDFAEFMDRCGQDAGSMVSSVYFDGFGGKEPLYSLFGIKYFYTNSKSKDFLYGITPYDTKGIEALEHKNVFTNDYVLPAGITYDSVMPKQWYDSLSQAELPFGIMDCVYLEGYGGETDDPSASESEYSIACDTEFERNVSSTDEYGMEHASNKLTLKDDVSGCFLYLSLEGVNCRTEKEIYGKKPVFSKDGIASYTGFVESQNWPWRRGIDSYTFALGYTENNIDTIEFDSEFNFDTENVRLTAIPKEVFIDLYNARSAEAMTDLSLSTNTLTGKVNVSSDKVLTIGLLHNDGWTAYVDGEKTKTYNANGVFIGFPIKAGSHDIKLVYRTPGLYEGALISVIVIITVITAEIILYRKRNKNTEERKEKTS